MLLIGAVAPTALAAGPNAVHSAHGNWRIANAHIANGSLPAAEKKSWDRAMGQCNATLIVGTGRAGTSFLVALLTRLGTCANPTCHEHFGEMCFVPVVFRVKPEA